jgi:RHS repeat-associated protein
VDVLTDGTGAVLERTSFDAFGKRRPSNWTPDPNDVYTNERLYRTARGYTGHEHLDNVGLIHMNGRVYDPALGRFTSPDPFVQFPESTQGLNRYSYVNNNPLSYTDPSGFFLDKLLKYTSLAGYLASKNETFRQALSIASLFIPLPGVNIYLAAAIRGFASGLISSNGDLRSGLVGAATAGFNQWAFGPTPNLTATEIVKTVALNTIAAQDAKLGQVLMFMQGSIGLSPGEMFQNAVGHTIQYQASRKLGQWAGRHGLTLAELNLLLTVNSFAGKELAGTTFNSESGTVEGFFSRDDSGAFGTAGKYVGVIWDVNDTLLNAQGLLDAVSVSVVRSGYSGPLTGHSLGAWRVDNLHRQGFASDATLLSLPGPAYPSARTQGACGNLDLICGGAPMTLVRPGTTPVESPSAMPWQWINQNHKIDTVKGYDRRWPGP